MGGRDSAPNPAGGVHSAPPAPSWWEGVAAQESHRILGLCPFGLARDQRSRTRSRPLTSNADQLLPGRRRTLSSLCSFGEQVNMRRSSITTALRDLHWLPVKHRITFEVATLMHQALHRRCPAYLADLVAYLRANFSLPSPLVFNLGPMYATDRQMSNAHHR